jgi:hypothetical protein
MSIDDYVVEWSPHQKQFHVETVKQMLKCNARIFAGSHFKQPSAESAAKENTDAAFSGVSPSSMCLFVSSVSSVAKAAAEPGIAANELGSWPIGTIRNPSVERSHPHTGQLSLMAGFCR